MGTLAALLWLRLTLWRRAIVGAGGWVRTALGVLALLVGAVLSAGVAFAAWASIDEALDKNVSAAEILGVGVGGIFLFRLWFAIVAAARGPLLEPARWLRYPVSQRLVFAVNAAATLVEPPWLFWYPTLAVLSLRIGRLYHGPFVYAPALACAGFVVATIGLFSLVSALGSSLDASPVLRRLASVALLLGWVGLSSQAPEQSPFPVPIPFLPTGKMWRLLQWAPPGFVERAARASGLRSATRLAFALGCLALEAIVAWELSYRLTLRRALQPPVEASPTGKASQGWLFPMLGERRSALVEMAARSLVRPAGWLLLLGPASFALLRLGLGRGASHGGAGLVGAVVYAHVTALPHATNNLGADGRGVRAYLTAPVTMRDVLGAKNAALGLYSLALFAMMLVVYVLTGGSFGPSDVAQALLIELATLPLLFLLGNLISVRWPLPAGRRQGRLAAPLLARVALLALIGAAAYLPRALTKDLGSATSAAAARAVIALGEAALFWGAYAVGLGAAARTLDARRERVLTDLAGE